MELTENEWKEIDPKRILDSYKLFQYDRKHPKNYDPKLQSKFDEFSKKALFIDKDLENMKKTFDKFEIISPETLFIESQGFEKISSMLLALQREGYIHQKETGEFQKI